MVIFGVDKILSPNLDNKKKRYFNLRKDPAQVLEHTLTADKLL